jgi:hypothetical protein
MTGRGKRPKETRQSVDVRQLREQLLNRAAERYRHRPLRRLLFVGASRSDVVLVGGGLAFLLLFSFISITGLKTGLEDWASWQPLLRDGITTQAIVVDGTDTGTGDHRIRYMYEATAVNGKSKSYEHWEGVNQFESFEVGDEVTIIYDPAEPSHSEIEGSQTYLLDIVIYLPGMCLFVLPTVLIIVLALAALGKLMVQWVRGQPGRTIQR